MPSLGRSRWLKRTNPKVCDIFAFYQSVIINRVLIEIWYDVPEFPVEFTKEYFLRHTNDSGDKCPRTVGTEVNF